MKLSDIIELVELELDQPIPPKTFHSAHEGHSVILEEFEELWKLIKKTKDTTLQYEKYKDEVVHLAAMVILFGMRFVPD